MTNDFWVILPLIMYSFEGCQTTMFTPRIALTCLKLFKSTKSSSFFSIPSESVASLQVLDTGCNKNNIISKLTFQLGVPTFASLLMSLDSFNFRIVSASCLCNYLVTNARFPRYSSKFCKPKNWELTRVSLTICTSCVLTTLQMRRYLFFPLYLDKAWCICASAIEFSCTQHKRSHLPQPIVTQWSVISPCCWAFRSFI